MKKIFAIFIFLFNFSLVEAQVKPDVKWPASHENKISQEEINNMHKRCEADQKKFCSQIPKGQGLIFKCLEKNYEKLSPSCKEMMKP